MAALAQKLDWILALPVATVVSDALLSDFPIVQVSDQCAQRSFSGAMLPRVGSPWTGASREQIGMRSTPKGARFYHGYKQPPLPEEKPSTYGNISAQHC